MGILDFISEITSAFSVTPVDADAPQADNSADQDESEEKEVNSKEENSEDGGEEENDEGQEEEEEEEEEPEDIKPKLEAGKTSVFDISVLVAFSWECRIYSLFRSS